MNTLCLRLIATLVTLMALTSLRAEVIDDFESLDKWRVDSSDGVEVEMAQDQGQEGMGMRLDFDFHGSGGFIIARRQLPMDLPDNYNFTFYIRGSAPNNNLEFKLIDPTGDNVWWSRKRGYEFPKEWRRVTIKKRHFSKAWGPSDRQEPDRISAIEIAITAGDGGKGSVWIDGLAILERPVTAATPAGPTFKASTTDGTTAPENLVDTDPDTGWHSGAIAEQQWLMVDFGRTREFGGLVIDWDRDDYAVAYDVEISDDGEQWDKVYSVEDSIGGRDYVYLPDAESRFLLLNLRRSSHGRGYGIRTLDVKPYVFSATPNDFYASIARDQKRGGYPRYFYNEQSYWTVTGTPGGENEALVNEDGMVELKAGGYSVEPFLYYNDRLVTWLDVQRTLSLQDGYLPIPTVTWHHDGMELEITALAAGDATDSTLYLRYRLSNNAGEARKGNLYLALRPFQVNPPWQSLNVQGGVGRIRSVALNQDTVVIDGATALKSLSPVQRFGAAKFEQGDITHYIKNDTLPVPTALDDQLRRASAALQYRFDLAPGERQTVIVASPLDGDAPSGLLEHAGAEAEKLWDRKLGETRRQWESLLNLVDIQLPGEAQDLVNTMKTTLAYIFINQDGTALQPGSRDYARSWIRDGSITSSALLAMGHTAPVRGYIQWYAGFQWPDGKVPCCVDKRGADPVPENDSHGQWIYLVMQYYRYTRDVGFLAQMWPSVQMAVQYMEALRATRLTDAYKEEGNRLFYGLMPDSISHEGYSARPVHSYWDDFFALKGYKDATEMAAILGYPDIAGQYAAMRDELRRDLYASIELSMARHGITYIPGAAELGDFDATSTAIAVDPAGELGRLPEPALKDTFDAYYSFFRKRREKPDSWTAYTPYELRIITALVRMGRSGQAHELLDFFFQGLRPPVWREWAEVVWRDAETPRFIGDMPHTWVGAEYLRALRTLLAYERESDHALVLAAGIPEDWMRKETGVTVRRLPTYYGALNYTYRPGPEGSLVMELSGDIAVPAGGIVVRSPLPAPISAATVNGEVWNDFGDHEVRIDRFPARVTLHFGADKRLAEGEAAQSGVQ